MFAGVEFVAAAIEFAGGDDFGGIIEIVALDAEELAVETQLETAVIMRLGADELHFIGPLGGDGERERERVADLAAGPPEVVVAAPATGLEGSHLLAAGLAAGDGEDLQRLTFDRAFQPPDAGSGGREAVRELQISDEIDHLLLGKRIKQAFGHERHREDLAFLDLALGDGEFRATRHDETERLRVFELDDAAHGGATLELEDVELVVFADDAVGVENVLKEVIELTDVGAGETRADLIADIAEGVADATGRREELATGRDIALSHGFGLQHGLILGLGLREVGLSRIDHAHDGGELAIEILVAERLQLTHHERRKQGLVGLTRGHGGEQRLAARGIAGERRDGVVELLRREHAEATEEHRRRIRVAHGGERLDERATERRRGLFGEDAMDDRSGGAIARRDEHGQRTLPGGQGGFDVGEMSAIKSAAGLVAGEGVELVQIGEQVGRRALTKAGDERGPASRGGERAGLADAFDHAAHEGRATRDVGLAGGDGEHLGAGAGIAGKTAIDEVGRLRMAADGRKGETALGVGADKGLDAIPEQQRDVMILGIFGAGQERLGDGGALGEREIGKRGSEFATDLRGGLGLREGGEGWDTSGPLLGDQTHGPAAHGRSGVLQRTGEERVIERTTALQRPKRTEATGGGAGFTQGRDEELTGGAFDGTALGEEFAGLADEVFVGVVERGAGELVRGPARHIARA